MKHVMNADQEDLVVKEGVTFLCEPLAMFEQQKFVVGTMGPSGTSSSLACEYFIRKVPAVLDSALYDNFDLLFQALLDGDCGLALVPNAYERITEYYWDKRLQLVCFFLRDTPSYGLACRPGEAILESGPLRVACCLPVRQLFDELAPADWRSREIEWTMRPSTTSAARAVQDGEADVAVSNQPSVDAANLVFVIEKPGVPMLWSVFCKRR
jgi:bacilysin biosynthesis protein BacA